MLVLDWWIFKTYSIWSMPPSSSTHESSSFSCSFTLAVDHSLLLLFLINSSTDNSCPSCDSRRVGCVEWIFYALILNPSHCKTKQKTSTKDPLLPLKLFYICFCFFTHEKTVGNEESFWQDGVIATGVNDDTIRID